MKFTLTMLRGSELVTVRCPEIFHFSNFDAIIHGNVIILSALLRRRVRITHTGREEGVIGREVRILRFCEHFAQNWPSCAELIKWHGNCQTLHIFIAILLLVRH